MKILLLNHNVPYPLHDGLSVRIYNLFSHLSKNHEIHLACHNALNYGSLVQQDTIDKLNKMFSRVSIVESQENKTTYYKQGLLGKFKNIFKFKYRLDCNSRQFQDVVNNYLATNKYDLIYCIGFDELPYILHDKKTPKVVDMIDSPMLLLFREMKTERSIINKLKLLKRLMLTKLRERLYLKHASLVLVVSEIDRRVIKNNCPDAEIKVIPNGVDLEYFKSTGIEAELFSLVFTGAMDYEPNVTAVMFFCKKIFPGVLSMFPQAKLNIIGCSPSYEILKLAKEVKNINVTGFVNDIRPYIEKSCVYICPMLSGAGIKNKILEALAMNKAVVATSMACEGITVTDKKDILIADNPADFVSSISILFQDIAYRERLGENGKLLVKNYHSWGLQAQKLTKIFEEITYKVKENLCR